MKAHLLYRDRDVDLDAPSRPTAADVVADLGLDPMLDAMAGDDKLIREVSLQSLLDGLTEVDEIAYRQAVLRDCLAHPDVVRDLYSLAVDTMDRACKVGRGYFRDSPDLILSRSVQQMELFSDVLPRVRKAAEEHVDAFTSDGFTTMFRMLIRELDDAYIATIADHLKTLRFKSGVLISAQLGAANAGRGFVLRRPRKHSWTERLPIGERSSYSFQLPPRDEAGARALADLRGRGINLVANALAQSADHVLAFFAMLRSELAFYVGCLNLHDRLDANGEPTCFPRPVARGHTTLRGRGLYDVSLSLSIDGRAVGNDIDADDRSLIVITGANQGGKSTFLRSLGQAQLMLQSGMFVGAEALRADVRCGVFTHFKREEDAEMRSGKLDDELARMSAIVDAMGADALVLFNESFASTNEREGAQIAREIIRALTEAGAKLGVVTHMYDLAHSLYTRNGQGTLFLRAERHEDGTRTFRLLPGEPLPTSYGEDLYQQIFGHRPNGSVPHRADQPTPPSVRRSTRGRASR